MKYIARAGHKVAPGAFPEAAALEDLQKAAWYLQREIEQLVKAA